MTSRSLCAVFACALLGSAPLTAPARQPVKPAEIPTAPVNPDFESGESSPKNPVKGWQTTTPATRAGLSPEAPAEGDLSAILSRVGTPAPGTFANLMQRFSAAAYRGKHVELTAMVRYKGTAAGQAQLWLRSDRPNGVMGFFDNMDDRPVRSPEWVKCTIVGDIEPDAEWINIGLLLMGAGPAGIDAVTFREVPPGPSADQPPRPLEKTAVTNLVAFTRLLGYVRHFHPSDESLRVSWPDFAIAAIDAVEKAPNAKALAETLTSLFAPVAPTVQVWAGPADRAPAPPSVPEGATQFVSLKHTGYGGDTPGNSGGAVYHSDIVREALDLEADKREGVKPGAAVVVDLGAGVSARIPVGVYAGTAGTIPKATGTTPRPERPDGWRPSGNDRATRLADVALAWTILKHFYPYFDVVGTDWDAALATALDRAAKDRDSAAFLDTLRWLVAQLKDGHGAVVAPRLTKQYHLPLDWEFVGDRLIITAVAPDLGDTGPKPGDTVSAIDGAPLADLARQALALTSGATDQWRRWAAPRQLLLRDAPDTVTLDLERPDGAKAQAKVEPSPAAKAAPKEKRPESASEVAPGILYVNLDGAEIGVVIKPMKKLAEADGVIFDMRGYPASAGTEILMHLTDQTTTSAKWTIPVFTMPDQKDVTFTTSNWTLPPKEPRITGKVAFLTDGRAISYAESCMEIVEAFKLGEIVGGTTAGTNGNINPFALPGGYRISWTGMRVVRHDGTVYHGVGVKPTVPVSRTAAGIAAGRDEVLEKAIEILAQKIKAEPRKPDVPKAKEGAAPNSP